MVHNNSQGQEIVFLFYCLREATARLQKMMLATLETAGGHPDTTGSDFNGPENFNLIQHFKFEFLETRQQNIAEIFQNFKIL